MIQRKIIFQAKKKTVQNIGLCILILVVAACGCVPDKSRIDEKLVGDWQAQEFIGTGGDALNIVHQMRLEKNGSAARLVSDEVQKGRWYVWSGGLYFVKGDEEFFIGDYAIDGDTMLTTNGKRKLVWHRQ
jgi:hypothetical protein